MTPEPPQEDVPKGVPKGVPRITIDVYEQRIETFINGVAFGQAPDGPIYFYRVMNALRSLGVREYTVRDQRGPERSSS